jgi:hypothetical protein
MLARLSQHRFVQGCTAFLPALAIYVAAVFLAYMLIGQVAKLAASGG